MNNKLNERISAVLSDLKMSLENEEEEVNVGGVKISRKEAQNMYNAFENYLESGKNIEWNIIPLSLASANINYRGIQQGLNNKYMDKER